MPLILVTGFEPFLGHARNPSALIAEGLDGTTVAGAELKGLRLPVTYGGAAPLLVDALEGLRPDALLMFGLAYETDAIRPERLALNLDDSAAADNDGVTRRNRPIDPNGPMGYWSTLPLDAIADRLEAEGIPVKPSRDAGGYICNHLFFQARHRLERQGAPVPAGFIHVPPLPDGIKPEDTGRRTGMELDRQLAAARLIVGVVAETLAVG